MSTQNIKAFELVSATSVICVSFAPEFNCFHYKVIATVIEND